MNVYSVEWEARPDAETVKEDGQSHIFRTRKSRELNCILCSLEVRKSRMQEGKQCRTSLVVQWLRLHSPNAGGPGSIPDQGTRSRMLQLKILHDPTEIPCAPTEIRCSQIIIFSFLKN